MHDFSDSNKAAFKEATKEIIRLTVLFLVSLGLQWLAGFDSEVTIILTGLLRMVDKWIHEHPTRFNGLLPF